MNDFTSKNDNVDCVEMKNLSPNKEHQKNCDSDSAHETLEVEITSMGE
jgi:hypothetical protein